MRYYSFDFETHLITSNDNAPKPVCWSYSDSKCQDTGVKIADDIDQLLDWLEDPEVTLIAHNMPFDVMVLCKHYGVPVSLIQREVDEHRLRDTLVRERLISIATGGLVSGIDPRTGYKVDRQSLAECAKSYLNIDLSEKKTDPDAWRLRYSELDGVPIEEYPKEAYNYALMDSVYAMKVFAAQCRETYQTEFGSLQDPFDKFLIRDEIRQTRASWDLHCSSTEGPYLDQEEVKEFKNYHQKVVDTGTEKLKELGVVWWNEKKKGTLKAGTREAGWSCKKKDLQALIEQDFTDQGVDVPRTKPTKKMLEKDPECLGNIKTDMETLNSCITPALIEYGECQKSGKLLSTYVPILEAAGAGRVASSPNFLVSTGRTSWAKPNLQNPPQKGGFRECFVPSEGNLFASIDYSAIELVALAQVLWEKFGCPQMMDAINEGKDLHMYFGAEIIGIPYEQCQQIRQDKSHGKFKLVSTARQLAKVFNFGSGGGQGAWTFFLQMDQSTKDAMQSIRPDDNILDIISDLIKLWKDTWQAWPYFRWVSNQTRKEDFCYEHPLSFRVRSNIGYTDGCNLMFQGRSADGAKNAMRLLFNWLYDQEQMHRVKCWAFVHDEFLLEGPAQTVTDWCQKVSETMVEGMQPFVPDVAVAAEPACMDRWMKEAEPFYIDGQLIPWTRQLHSEVYAGTSKQCIVQPYYANQTITEVKGPITEM